MIDKLQHNDEAALHRYRSLAPHAVRAHPSDEHLLPLYFARGAGGTFSIAYQGFTQGALGWTSIGSIDADNAQFSQRKTS